MRCSVTVGVVGGPAASGRGIYKGICSNYLSDRRAGDMIYATVRETKAGFRLPDDASVPIIMIGPGTGLAPFRGFLQERAARKAKDAALGPAMLFFGCRHPDQDYLYRDELKVLEASGITELFTAFARRWSEDLCAAPAREPEGQGLDADRAGRDHLCLR